MEPVFASFQPSRGTVDHYSICCWNPHASAQQVPQKEALLRAMAVNVGTKPCGRGASPPTGPHRSCGAAPVVSPSAPGPGRHDCGGPPQLLLFINSGKPKESMPISGDRYRHLPVRNSMGWRLNGLDKETRCLPPPPALSSLPIPSNTHTTPHELLLPPAVPGGPASPLARTPASTWLLWGKCM